MLPLRSLLLQQLFLSPLALLLVVAPLILLSTSTSTTTAFSFTTLVSSSVRRSPQYRVNRWPIDLTDASSSRTFGQRIAVKTAPRTILSSSSFSSPPEEFFSFDEMSKVDQRLEALEEIAPGFLFDYYEPRYCSFSIAPGQTEKLSITSTAYCLRALLDYPQEENMVNRLLPPSKDVIKALIQSDWRSNDLYVVSLIVLIIMRMDPTLEILVNSFKRDDEEEEEEEDDIVQTFMRLVVLVLSGRPQRRRGEQQLFSAYISYLCCSVYVDLKAATRRNVETGQLQLGMLEPHEYLMDFQNIDNIMQSQQIDSSAMLSENERNDNSEATTNKMIVNSTLSSSFWKELTIAISRTAEISFNELCRQLAYHTAGSSSFDVIKLVYSLLSYVKSCNSLRGTAGRELIAGQNTITTQGNSEKEEIIKLNPQLVSAALRVFFQEQDANTGLWERGQPIYKSFKRKGRNVGNAYVFGLDALGSLLEALPPEDFRPYLLNLQRSLNWIELNQDVEVIADYCDPDTGECSGKTLRGWTSPNLRYVFKFIQYSHMMCCICSYYLLVNTHNHPYLVHLEDQRHGPLLRL